MWTSYEIQLFDDKTQRWKNFDLGELDTVEKAKDDLEFCIEILCKPPDKLRIVKKICEVVE